MRELVSDTIDLTGGRDNDVNAEQSGCSLPRFDLNVKCSLCRLYARDIGAARWSPDENRDTTVLDATQLNELTRKFHQVKLMFHSSLVRAYGKKFHAKGRDHPDLAFLTEVTDDEVRRHFEEDHNECTHQF